MNNERTQPQSAHNTTFLAYRWFFFTLINYINDILITSESMGGCYTCRTRPEVFNHPSFPKSPLCKHECLRARTLLFILELWQHQHWDKLVFFLNAAFTILHNLVRAVQLCAITDACLFSSQTFLHAWHLSQSTPDWISSFHNNFYIPADFCCPPPRE